jgi:MscS family membrane protein
MMDPGYFHAAITVVVGLILAGAAHLVILWLKKKADEPDTELDNIILNTIGGPLVVAIVAVSIYAALTRFDVVPESLSWLITDQIITSVFILLGAWITSGLSFTHCRMIRWISRFDILHTSIFRCDVK